MYHKNENNHFDTIFVIDFECCALIVLVFCFRTEKGRSLMNGSVNDSVDW